MMFPQCLLVYYNQNQHFHGVCVWSVTTEALWYKIHSTRNSLQFLVSNAQQLIYQGSYVLENLTLVAMTLK